MEKLVSDQDEKPLDLREWEAQLPPSDFAEKVLARVRAEEKPKPAPKPSSNVRRIGIGGGVVAALALAAAFFLKVGGPPDHGDATAQARTEVLIGARAKAVLEPGARVSWNGDDVVQSKGDVFYRVEPGKRFTVHTAAGDVEVKGTCFAVKVRGEEDEMQKRDVKSGAVGAALSALAFVAVYEGKVAVSHASQHADLAAGESAQLGKDGVVRSADVGEGQKKFDANVAAAHEGDPFAKANENLVAQVDEYRKRLELLASQKADVEKKLETAQQKLSADAGPPRNRSEWDLDHDDWLDLARQGRIKFRIPCLGESGWDYSGDKLNKLGLAPDDSKALHDAFKHSFDRIWSVVKPLCMQALGTTAEVVDRIGPNQCISLVYDLEDKDTAADSLFATADIRAGLRPEPGPKEKVDPALKMFLTLTTANQAFEQDLAKSFGPEEAHRLVYSEDMCTSNNRWGAGKSRGKDVDSNGPKR
jgi:ferric-dicitrate binding protein FerR (iron transport regulator)